MVKIPVVKFSFPFHLYFTFFPFYELKKNLSTLHFGEFLLFFSWTKLLLFAENLLPYIFIIVCQVKISFSYPTQKALLACKNGQLPLGKKQPQSYTSMAFKILVYQTTCTQVHTSFTVLRSNITVRNNSFFALWFHSTTRNCSSNGSLLARSRKPRLQWIGWCTELPNQLKMFVHEYT